MSSGRSRTALLVAMGLVVIVALGLYVGTGLKKPAPTGTQHERPLPSWIRPHDVDLSRSEVLLDSFEWDRTETYPWGGGNLSDEHVTEGGQSYRVHFTGASLRGFYCFQGYLVPDFSRHQKLLLDATSADAPFPVSLTLVGRKQGETFTFGNVDVQPFTTTLEFDLSVVPASVRASVGALQISSGLKPEGRLTGFFDNLRLAKNEGPTLELPSEGQALVLEAKDNFLADGEFNFGFGLWRFQRWPGGRWTLSFLRGREAYEGGPSLAIYGLQKGGMRMTSPELNLAPGRYLAYMACRGSDSMRWSISLDEFEEGIWTTVSRTEPTEPAGVWKVVDADLSVRSEGGESRVARLNVDFYGVGNAFVDAVVLESWNGFTPQAEEFQAYSPTPVDGGHVRQISRWRWNGHVLGEVGSGEVFPVYYLQEDFQIDGNAREFGQRCREAGLEAALDLGGALHALDFGLLLERVHFHAQDSAIGAWLLTAAADWRFSEIAPGALRRATELLSTQDHRLLAVGLRGRESQDSLAHLSKLYRYVGTSDVLVVADETRGGVKPDHLQVYESSLRDARKVCASRSPFLASIVIGPSRETLRLKFFLAHLYGAAGILLVPPADGAISELPWSFLKGSVAEYRQLARKLSTASRVPATCEEADLRVRGYRLEGESYLLVANVSPKRLSAVNVRTKEAEIEVTLKPWEVQEIDLGER